MSILKTALATLIATALLAAAAAQTGTGIRGRVTDASDGEPVAGAVVKLTDAEGNILRYAITDGKGAFTLAHAAPAQGCRLRFSMLGYAARDVTPDDWSAPVTAVLDPAATQIREVVVKAPRISMQGDTISYNARSFTDIKDKSLADILKKMPGIEVSKSGQVKYQGEAINKLYIDGVDMLGDRYGMATKNIAPQDIKSVDVMENHQPKKVLRDVEFSEKAALNIRMEDRIRNQWSGSASAGGGFSPALWNGSLFAMCMAKRYSTMQSLKSNDTGVELGTETGIFGTEGGGYSLPQYIGVGTTSAPIDRIRTRFNTSHLYNTANTFHLSEDYDLHASASYLYDRLTSENSSRTTYFVGDDSFSVENAAEAADASHTLAAEVRLSANTEKFYLNDMLSADIAWREAWRSTEGTYPNMQRADTPSQQVKNSLEFIRRLGKRTLTLRSVNMYMRSPQSLTVERGQSLQRQRTEAWAFWSNTSAAFGRRLGRFNLTLDGSFTQLVRGLDSSLEGLEMPDMQTVNDMRLSMSKIEARPSLAYKGRRFNATLAVPLAYRFYSVRDRIDPSMRRRMDDPTAAPALSGTYRLSPMLSLSGSASYSMAPIDESKIYSGAIMNDYRYITRGYLVTDNNSTAALTLRAEYKNPLASLFVNVNAGYTSAALHAAASQDFAGDYIITSAVAASCHVTSRYLRGGISKGIDALKGKAGIDAQLTSASTGLVQDSRYDPYDSQTLSVEPMFNLRFTAWWSAEYRLDYTLSRLRVGTTGAKSSTSGMSHSLTTTLQPVKGLRLEASAEHYRTQTTPGSHKNMALLDAKAAYTFKNGWELSATARNLLDKREYAYSLFNGPSASSASYRIRPRNVLLGLYMKF